MPLLLNSFLTLAMLPVLVLISSGCGGTNADGMFAEHVDSNPKRLGTLYTQFQTNNVKKRLLGPASLNEFKDFINQQNSDGLARIGVDKESLDDLFISRRDKQPFKIRWAVQGVSRGPAQPVIFEEEGLDGKFVVGFTGFIEKKVDQAEYDRLWSGAADEGS